MKDFSLSRRVVLASPLLLLPITAQAQTLREKLESGIAGMQRAAARLGLTGSWDQVGIPVRATLLPPASEARIAAIEAEVGRPMPPELRRFFREVTAGLDVVWMLPGKRSTTQSGSSTVNFSLFPPAPFSDPGPPVDPTFNGGALRIMLDDLPGFSAEAQMWLAASRELEESETDSYLRAHGHYHATVWERGHPIARTMGGDIIAVDTASAEEKLIILRHDGDDAPALLLGQDLPTHLMQQALLLFPGFETFRMEFFADEERGRAAIADFAPTLMLLSESIICICHWPASLTRTARMDVRGENGWGCEIYPFLGYTVPPRALEFQSADLRPATPSPPPASASAHHRRRHARGRGRACAWRQ